VIKLDLIGASATPVTSRSALKIKSTTVLAGFRLQFYQLLIIKVYLFVVLFIQTQSISCKLFATFSVSKHAGENLKQSNPSNWLILCNSALNTLSPYNGGLEIIRSKKKISLPWRGDTKTRALWHPRRTVVKNRRPTLRGHLTRLAAQENIRQIRRKK